MEIKIKNRIVQNGLSNLLNGFELLREKNLMIKSSDKYKNACVAPQRMKLKVAPCQKPLTRNVTKIDKQKVE